MEYGATPVSLSQRANNTLDSQSLKRWLISVQLYTLMEVEKYGSGPASPLTVVS